MTDIESGIGGRESSSRPALGGAAPDAIRRVWAVRERVEWEAADQFAGLGQALESFYGSRDPVARMALEAAADERRHAVLCRAILDEAGGAPALLEPELGASLGPMELPAGKKILYAAVALSCITETLSTALLIAMHKKARAGIVRETVHEILEDEISHSRLGWAELARASQKEDVTWLGRYVPRMLGEAISSDVRPLLRASDIQEDLSGWGILSPSESGRIIEQAIREVILPGLWKYGIGGRPAG